MRRFDDPDAGGGRPSLLDRLVEQVEVRKPRRGRIWPPPGASPLDRLCGPMDRPLSDLGDDG